MKYASHSVRPVSTLSLSCGALIRADPLLICDQIEAVIRVA
jgi:hypothetical protein